MRERGTELNAGSQRDGEAGTDPRRGDRRAGVRRFADAFRGAPSGMALIWVDDAAPSRMFELNAALCRITGYSREQLLKIDLRDLLLIDDREAVRAEAVRLLAGEIDEYRLETRFRHAEGHLIWVQVDAAAIRDDDDAPPYLIVQFQDVTARRRAMQRLEAENLVERVLDRAATVDGAVASLASGLGRALECDFVGAWLLDDKQDRLRCAAVWTPPASAAPNFERLSRHLTLSTGSGLPGRVWERGEPVWTADLGEDADAPRADAARDDHLRGAVAFPLFVGSELIGVIELLTQGLGVRDDELMKGLTAITTRIGDFLARKRAEEQARGTRELLLVEDNAFIARVAREMLDESDLHLELEHVERLADAREHLMTRRPACVLLDLTLPDAEGLEGLAELRKVAPDVPIVILTGHEDEQLAVRAVQEGAQDYLIKRKVGLDGLAQSIRYAMERKRAEQRLFEHMLIDRLTGLPNRALFVDRLNIALARLEPRRSGLAVLLVNVDRFRTVNDSLGHDTGDEALARLAERIRAAAGDDATVASFGGDEFAVLIESPTVERPAAALAERLRCELSRPLDDLGVRLTATIGIALGSGGRIEAESLLEQADNALSRGKELGGDRVEVFEEKVRERMRERMRIETGLRGALENDDLRVFYQPIVSLASGDTVAVEALVRWQHPQRGLVSPGEFIPVAEQSGLIVPMGEWVLCAAFRQLAEWHAAGGESSALSVNVNLSARQVTAPNLIDVLSGALASAGIEPASVCLEVTESSLMDDVDASIAALTGLKEMGVVLALDDFGTGYSSLSYLQRFPVDALKLDRSFVDGLGRRPEARAIVTAIAEMARALELTPVAEGIETGEQLAELRELGYELAQGYLLGRPAPPEELVAGLGKVPAA